MIVGTSLPTSRPRSNCPRCNSQWREAEYDYETLAKTLPLQLPGRPFDLWRYRELLPVRNANPSLTPRRRRYATRASGKPRHDAGHAQPVHQGRTTGANRLFQRPAGRRHNCRAEGGRNYRNGSRLHRERGDILLRVCLAGRRQAMGVCHQPGARRQNAGDCPLWQPGGQGDRLL